MQKPLNRDAIKLAAMATMACNHFAQALLPGGTLLYTVLVDIGYFTAPVMCWFLVEGFGYTRSRGRYALRLAGFALLAQAPYVLALGYGQFNMLFTLLLCFLMLWALDALHGRLLCGAGGAGACLCHRVLRLAAAGRLTVERCVFLPRAEPAVAGAVLCAGGGAVPAVQLQQLCLCGLSAGRSPAARGPHLPGRAGGRRDHPVSVQRPAQRPGPAAPGGGQIFLLCVLPRPSGCAGRAAAGMGGMTACAYPTKIPPPFGRRAAGSL